MIIRKEVIIFCCSYQILRYLNSKHRSNSSQLFQSYWGTNFRISRRLGYFCRWSTVSQRVGKTRKAIDCYWIHADVFWKCWRCVRSLLFLLLSYTILVCFWPNYVSGKYLELDVLNIWNWPSDRRWCLLETTDHLCLNRTRSIKLRVAYIPVWLFC